MGRGNGLQSIGGLAYPQAKAHKMADGVWYDSAGSSGTAFDVGSATNPCSDWDDLLTIAAAYNLKRIYVTSAGTLDTTGSNGLKGYHLYRVGGDGFNNLLDPDGEDLDGTTLHDIVLGSTSGQVALGGSGLITAQQCAIVNVTNLGGTYYECGFAGINQFSGGNTRVFSCGTQQFTACTFDLTNLSSGSIHLTEWVGALKLTNLTGGTVHAHVKNGAEIEVDVTCTGGTIIVYGDGIVTNDKGGATVLDYTAHAGREVIAHHLHRKERWFGAPAGWDGTNEVDAADQNSLTAYQSTTGNDTFGTADCIVGSGDTPATAGNQWFDLHSLRVITASANRTYKIRIAWGASYAAGVAAGDYTEIIYRALSAALYPVPPIDLGMIRLPVGTKVFIAAWSGGGNADTLDFVYGLHEYDDEYML